MISVTDRQLLSLVAAGLEFCALDVDLFSTGVDWQAIYHQAVRQTVVGMAYDGLSQLPVGLRPSRNLLLQWYGQVRLIEQGNAQIDGVLSEVIERYHTAGLHPVLLKGQGVGQYYPNPSHRQPGDIDLYWGTDCPRANQEITSWPGVKFEHETSYHQSYVWQGIDIENHSKYVDFYSAKNRRLWRAFSEKVALTDGEKQVCGHQTVLVPSPTMNAVYLYLHLQHHFLQVGVGLRQVCDWLCLLRSRRQQIDGAVLKEAVQGLPFLQSMKALAYVAVTYLHCPLDLFPFIWDEDATCRDGELMLSEIMKTGNFGHDTPTMRSFKRGRFLGNLRSYSLALRRHVSIYRLCPSEVRAYPITWLKSKCQKGK